MDSLIKKEVVIGDCRLLLGDCLSIMPTLGKVDAVVTDPPFGIGNFVQTSGNRRGNAVTWNDDTPPESLFGLLRSISSYRVIWGAEHFNCFEGHGALVWDKCQPMPNFSKVEIASKSWGRKTDVYRRTWTNFVNNKVSSHPCERPVDLYEWSIAQIPKKPKSVIDPFMGSGSCGVACVRLGIGFIGIELDPDYFEIACKRIRDAYAQPDMFVEQPKPAAPVQEGLDFG